MIKTYFYPLLLALIIGVICYANYTPGTFLSGWDTLHPEFNFSLAFQRIFNGVWRSDQGLGAVAMQSHMVELPRIIYLAIASLFLPETFLRYSYFFLMLFLGPLGIYYLTKNFTSALIYLANLGTVQHFSVPLEMFATEYGLLPWIFLISKKILENNSKKLFILFTLLSFFASSMAHTATLWYAFFAAYILFLAAYRQSLKKSLVLIAILLATNAYWLLPNIYATVTHGKDVQQAKVNRLFTPEAVAKGEVFANIKNAALLKNFLFDWELYQYEKSTFEQVLSPWQEHIKNPLVKTIGFSVFVLSLLGILKAIKQKNTLYISFIPIFVIALLMLLWRPPITGILAEALRFPFTKFSILLMFSMSIFAGFVLPKRMTVIAILALLFYFYPAFTGKLINPAMRITIPNQYFEMFAWFNSQDHDGRVANLPIHSFYNWAYYDWGYQGAGFLQFGIPQPLLDRDYDRWNPANEQYMREMTYAVYSQKPELLKSVLEKFNIAWVLVDNSVINIGGRSEATYTWILPEILEKTGVATLEKSFGEKIKIYKITTAKKSPTFYENLPSIGPKLDGAPEDTVYTMFGPYISIDSGNQSIDPYRQAFTHDERFTYDVTNKIPIIDTKNLEHKNAYLVAITHKNISGFPMQICISNPYNRKCDLIVRLKKSKEFITEQFLLPPLFDNASGYSVDSENLTIGNIISNNDLQNITFYQINYDEIIGKNTYLSQNQNNTIVTNNQSFDSGWIALQNGKLLKNHVLVNNWANGWILEPSAISHQSSVTFFYWPQLLEWIGFLGIVLCMIALRHFHENTPIRIN